MAKDKENKPIRMYDNEMNPQMQQDSNWSLFLLLNSFWHGYHQKSYCPWLQADVLDFQCG